MKLTSLEDTHPRYPKTYSTGTYTNYFSHYKPLKKTKHKITYFWRIFFAKIICIYLELVDVTCNLPADSEFIVRMMSDIFEHGWMGSYITFHWPSGASSMYGETFSHGSERSYVVHCNYYSINNYHPCIFLSVKHIKIDHSPFDCLSFSF